MRSAMTLYEIPASDIFMINSSSSGVMYETVLSGGRCQPFARSFIILLRIVLAGRPSSFPICPEVMPDLTHSSIARSSSLVQIITEKPVMPTPSGKKNAPPRESSAGHKPAEGGRGWGRSEAVVRNFRTTRYARGKDRSSCGVLDGRWVCGVDQLRPDQMPVIRPKIAAGNGSIGGSLNTDAKLCADAMSDAYRLAQVSNRRAALSANLFAFGIRCGVQVLQEFVHGHMLPTGKVSVNACRQIAMEEANPPARRYFCPEIYPQVLT